MRERGSKLNRYIDFCLGIPLVWLSAAFRAIFRRKGSAVKPAYADGGWKQPQNIAILCFGAVGDTVLLSALIKALAGRHLELDIYVSSNNKGLEKLLPPVNAVYSFSLMEIPQLIAQLRQRKYQYLIDSSPWARLSAIVAALSDAMITVGFDTAGQHRACGYDIAVPHMSDRHEWLNFLALGQAIFPNVQATPSLRAPNITVDYRKPYIICHMWSIGSNSEERMWPSDKWAELIKLLVARGFYILLSGSKDDRANNHDFIENHLSEDIRSNVSLLMGDWHTFAGVAMQAAAVVAVNTGSMHIASLLNVPTVGLHGPTSPLRWGPVGRRSIALAPEGAHSFLNLGFETTKDDSAYCYRLELAQVLEALGQLGIL